MDKSTITIIIAYIIFFIVMFNFLFPKESEMIKYYFKKIITKFFKIFEPIVFELKQYLLY